jgi:hypothetical protein
LSTVIARTITRRDVAVVGDKLYFPDIHSVATDGTGPSFFRWARTNLDGTNLEVLWEVPRLDGPLDVSSFRGGDTSRGRLGWRWWAAAIVRRARTRRH